MTNYNNIGIICQLNISKWIKLVKLIYFDEVEFIPQIY